MGFRVEGLRGLELRRSTRTAYSPSRRDPVGLFAAICTRSPIWSTDDTSHENSLFAEEMSVTWCRGWGLGFGVVGLGAWGLGLGVWGLGFGVWGLGFGVWVLGFGVWGLGFGVWGFGFMVRVEH